MKNKIVVLFLTCIIFHAPGVHAAVIDDVTENMNSGAVTVTGSGIAGGDEVFIEVFDYEDTAYEKPVFAGVFEADADGNLAACFSMPDSVETGKKTAAARARTGGVLRKDFDYFSAVSIISVTADWNNAIAGQDRKLLENILNNEASLKVLINTNLSSKLAAELIDVNKDKLTAELLTMQESDSIEEISKMVAEPYINFAVNNASPETAASLTGEFYDIIDTKKGDIYNDILLRLSDAQRNEVYISALNKTRGNLTNENITDLIYSEAVMYGFKQKESYTELSSYMKKYNGEYFKADFSDYETLKNTYPVDSGMIKQKDNYKTFDELRGIFESLVKQQKKAETAAPKKSSGGGGGGGGGGIKSPAVVPAITQEPTEAETVVFKDLKDYSWAENYIMVLYDKGVVDGVGNGNFEPSGCVLREQFVKMLAAFMPAAEAAEKSGFTDVVSGEWYEKYIDNAKESGIIKGNTDGSFGIGKKITRQDAAVMLLNAVVAYDNEIIANAEAGAPEFSDIDDISSYALYSVSVLGKLGIVKGGENGKFNPLGTATRAEAAVMIGRVMELIDGEVDANEA
ncbi:MAG: S-layer homology domain-containing protein [Clostridia bacterium]|nr:S-layer homology domain-containing protein [Clostridia bacterium]